MTDLTATTLVTASAVAQACEAIKAEGNKPSVRTVRARLGGGSPNDIAPLLADWKKGVRVVEAQPIQISKAIHDAIADQIRTEAGAAQKDAAESQAALEADVEELTTAGRAAEALVKTLDAELEGAKGQVQSLIGQIDQLRADGERIKREAAEQIRTTEDRAAAAVAKAEDEASRERKDREATIASLGQANARLEALPRLEGENERLRAELEQARTEAAKQHELSAVATATLEAERKHRQAIEVQLVEATKRADSAAQALVEERVAAQACQARLEAAKREIDTANGAANQARVDAKKAGEDAAGLRGQLSAATDAANQARADAAALRDQLAVAAKKGVEDPKTETPTKKGAK
jgi:chromosome segregation ATPase